MFCTFLILLISYVNYSIGLKPDLTLIQGTPESARRLEQTLNLLGIELWLSVRQADTLTAGLNHAYLCFVLFNSTY